VVDLTEQEHAAIAAAVKPVAETMRSIGWSTRLENLSEEQVMALIAAAVRGFQDTMHAIARAGQTESLSDAAS